MRLEQFCVSSLLVCPEIHSQPSSVLLVTNPFLIATTTRHATPRFETGPRIKGAVYMDMADVATTKELFPDQNPKGLPAMMPPKDLFAATMDRFGISNNDHVSVVGAPSMPHFFSPVALRFTDRISLSLPVDCHLWKRWELLLAKNMVLVPCYGSRPKQSASVSRFTRGLDEGRRSH